MVNFQPESTSLGPVAVSERPAFWMLGVCASYQWLNTLSSLLITLYDH